MTCGDSPMQATVIAAGFAPSDTDRATSWFTVVPRTLQLTLKVPDM